MLLCRCALVGTDPSWNLVVVLVDEDSEASGNTGSRRTRFYRTRRNPSHQDTDPWYQGRAAVGGSSYARCEVLFPSPSLYLCSCSPYWHNTRKTATWRSGTHGLRGVLPIWRSARHPLSLMTTLSSPPAPLQRWSRGTWVLPSSVAVPLPPRVTPACKRKLPLPPLPLPRLAEGRRWRATRVAPYHISQTR